MKKLRMSLMAAFWIALAAAWIFFGRACVADAAPVAYALATPGVTETSGYGTMPWTTESAAVVRITSHGCSATIIDTGTGWTLLLTCAHAFQGSDRARPIKLHGLMQTRWRAGLAQARLIAIDSQADLALIFLENGPASWVLPVAPPGSLVPAHLINAGYSKMCWPVDVRPATPIGSDGAMQFVREPPIPGQSGGPLYDPVSKRLFGVCHGYETSGPGRGLWVSHAQILAFLSRQGKSTIPPVFDTGAGSTSRSPLPAPPFS